MLNTIHTNQQDSPIGASASKTITNTSQSGLLRILLVDDEYFISEFLSLAFRAEGIKVTEAENGLEAFKLFQAQPSEFDLVITDYQMPEMNGRELITALKKIDPNRPMILCSGSSLNKIGKGEEDYFMKKPYPLEKLVQVAFGLLDQEP